MEMAQVVDHRISQEGAIGMDGPTTSERHISSKDDVVIDNVDQLEDNDDPGGGEKQVWSLTQY